MAEWTGKKLLVVSPFAVLDCVLADHGQDFLIHEKKLFPAAEKTVFQIHREADTLRTFIKGSLGENLLRKLLSRGGQERTRFKVSASGTRGDEHVLNCLLEPFEQGGALLRMMTAADGHDVEENPDDSEALYQTVIRKLPVTVFLKDAQGRTVLANDKLAEVYGTAPEELQGLTDFELADKGLMSHARALGFTTSDDRVRETKNDVVLFEGSISSAGGSRGYFRTEKSAFDTDNFPGWILGVGVDISREKRIQEELEERLNFQETLLDTIPIPIYFQDRDLVYRGCNKAFLELTGLSREELIGRKPDDVWSAERAAVYVRKDKELIERKGRHAESRREEMPSGEVLDLVVVKGIYEDGQGDVAGLVSAAIDLTEQRRIQQALQESEARYRRMFEESVLGIFLARLDGSLYEVNSAFSDMFGCESAVEAVQEVENIGRVILSPSHQVLRDFQARLEVDEPVVFEAQYWRPDGTVFTGRTHMIRVQDPVSQEIHVEGMIENVTGKRAFEEKLLTSEERFRKLYESVQVGVLVQKPDGRIEHVNRLAEEILDLPAEEITSRTDKHPDWQMVLEDGTPVPGEEHPSMITLRTGEPLRNVIRGMYGGERERTRWLIINTTPLFEKGGERVSEVIATFSDITELKRTRDELVESERRLATLMGNLPGMAYRCRNDSDWTMEFVSKGCLPLTGYPSEDLIQNRKQSYAELVHPEDRERVWNAVQSGVNENRQFQLEYRIRTREGEERWVWERGCMVDVENGGMLEGFIIDISDRKQAMQDLQEQEEHFRTVYEESPVGIAVVDMEMRFEDINPAFEELIGYPGSEMRGKHLRDITHPEDLEENMELQRKLAEGSIPQLRMEKRLLHKDGHVVDALLVASLIRDAEGRPLHFLGQVLDISRRRQAEEAVRRINEELEERVHSRTMELEQVNEDLRRFAKLAAGREIRMAELKQEVRKLQDMLETAREGDSQ